MARNDLHGFSQRHIGISADDTKEMLQTLNATSMGEFIESVVPPGIRSHQPLHLDPPLSEAELLDRAYDLSSRNTFARSFLGMGYYDTITPSVILRNILENPGWYTAYTPYQAEISQGRLEALLNFQTMIMDLTGMPIANASLLDEATAAAEAVTMIAAIKNPPADSRFLVAEECHPQTIAVVQTRAHAQGIAVEVKPWKSFDLSGEILGVLLQYPATDGAVYDYREVIERVHDAGGLAVVAADPLSLTLLTPPGEFGADIVVGSTQRFGVPMGFGGPHAAYFATLDKYKRHMPGRIIGVSIDSQGKRAYRMALQTREQHIRREKATSNICTAQVLLAVMAGMYAVYHGPSGLKSIAARIHHLAEVLVNGIERAGHRVIHKDFFDTVHFVPALGRHAAIKSAAEAHQVNLRMFNDGSIGVALDEATSMDDVAMLLGIIALPGTNGNAISAAVASTGETGYQGPLKRTTSFLQHPVFHKYHSETEMLRYIHRLESKDLSLTTSMIPLGSCTMKLNATTEMMPISWGGFSRIHPFAPDAQTQGYREIIQQLSRWLSDITGFPSVSMQPNAGSQGEFTGLLVIRAYHDQRNESHRNVCLIPASAHGTNPASAVMAGMEIVVVRCDERGNIDLADLKFKAEQHHNHLAALMVTYPSTHGVFEEGIQEVCKIVHAYGGQVYMDGANMNALVGLCRPSEIGADVCHINLHKTFSIPHGGGGPGMGPIACAAHLAPFLPGHPVVNTGGTKAIGPVSAAPYGSASILVISWAYIAMMGGEGLRQASEAAILNANYMARRLEGYFPVLYRGDHGRVAHECILDLREFKSVGIEAEDVAKRLMDYGFHAPTVSFPVAGTLMIEPTESESREELDRFCAALIAIHGEIQEVVGGTADPQNNVLKNAPHTAEMIASDSWSFPYGREKAAFPLPILRTNKFWPSVGRINSAFGDRNLVCSCPPIEEYEEAGKS